jgi:glycosyltransferase involved in cell wall biosynthesis
MKMRILAFCDSPTLTSGFAKVAQNLFRRWHNDGAEIDVWGIGFVGWGYRRAPYVNQLFPGGVGSDWNTLPRLELFLSQLASGGYTHLWLMQDTFMLSVADFPAKVREICNQRNIHSTLYFPVDAPLDPEWTDIIAAVDVPVAYTHYGKREAEAKGQERGHTFSCEVLPHGVDTDIYSPIVERGELRKQLWQQPWVGPDDFLLLNVNANQRRKDVSRCLEILCQLRQQGVPAKLLMHMPETSGEGLSLEAVGRQFGLKLLEDWAHHGFYFRRGNAVLGEAELAKYYNVADLYLTTTLGEGWGLGITEALACGCPAAVPLHTACQEIYEQIAEGRMVGLPTEYNGVVLDGDNSRVRHRVNVQPAVNLIRDYYESGAWRIRPELSPSTERWLSWGRIASEMLRLMKRRALARVHKYYLEYGGGLGDVFSQLHQRGSYNVLRDLQPGERAKVAIISHNPYVKELFEWHPKRHQIDVLDCGYWHGQEADAAGRLKHRLPAPGANGRLPVKDASIEFHCPSEDDDYIAGLLKDGPVLLLALAAGLPNRTIPQELVDQIVPLLRADGRFNLVSVGRTYERHGRKEHTLSFYRNDVIDAVDRLSVPGTAKLLQASVGLVTCHSALNLLGWYLHTPQLLLYPESVFHRHIARPDQWAFGINFPETVHCQFNHFTPAHMERFLGLLPDSAATAPALANS